MKKQLTMMLLAALVTVACGGTKKPSPTDVDAEAKAAVPVGPTFQADSAFEFCRQQCLFGPRTMNSDAHEKCGQWIATTFRSYGMTVVEQQATLTGYDGTPLRSTNIIASYRPEKTDRVMICAHWDSRPWADNDPVEANRKTPVLAANDGASGVAVMLELARLLSSADTAQLNPELGVDFICFDAEDWGVPQWAETDGYTSDSWALGAQHWAAHPHAPAYSARFAILLDMVGGQGSKFYREIYSKQMAGHVQKKVWKAARTVGYGSFFPMKDGGGVTDDHVPVNDVAHIPCIDIIPYYPDCSQSSFGPTWHTLQDDLDHIDRGTLRAVGQTLVQVLFSE